MDKLFFQEGFVPFDPSTMTKDDYEMNCVFPILVIDSNEEEGTETSWPVSAGYPIDDD